MSWIKPNFLWMMYRSGWATKPRQEHVLAVRITRAGFDTILAEAVASTFWPEVYADREAWQRAGKASCVRMQWDPDHAPTGGKLERRAIQLGLRGETLARYVTEWVREIEDVTPFVAEQRANAKRARCEHLITPSERVYPVSDPEVARRIRVDSAEPNSGTISA